PGVARAQPAILGQRIARRLRLLEVALEHGGRADQHFAARIDAHTDARANPPDRVGVGLSVALQRGETADLGRAVDLLRVDPERAEEAEGGGAERRRARISPAPHAP